MGPLGLGAGLLADRCLAPCLTLRAVGFEGEVAPSGYLIDGLLGFSQELRPAVSDPDCRCQKRIGMGDAAAPAFIPKPTTATS